MESKKLILIGGGHAHLETIADLDKFTAHNIEVTVIQPSRYHYYSGMGPGMLGGSYRKEEIRFNTRKLVEQRKGCFLADTAVRIDPQNQLVYVEKNEQPLSYDLLSCNIGSTVKTDIIQPDYEVIFSVKPIEQLDRLREQLLEKGQNKSLRVAILGGGPSAVEVAGNIRQLGTRGTILQPDITIFSGGPLLKRAEAKARKLTLTSLHHRGIRFVTDEYVSHIEKNTIHFSNLDSFTADIIISAVGLTCPPLFKKSGLPVSEDNGLLVNDFLHSVSYPNIFGGGDGITFTPSPLDKVGVYAVRQGPILAHNLLASLTRKPLLKFNPGGDYLLIYNLGDTSGVFSRPPFIFHGRLAFFIKDFIDRRFVKKFR